jgi:lipopolysaccharide transport system ATP-binding protein
MSSPVIHLNGIGKKYSLHATPSALTVAHGAAVSLARTLLGRKRVAAAETGEFWALRDINLDIQEGDVVGIVGRNGAGKSTLLKILSQITAPTTGHAEIRGRIGSLLEVGTGFNPELSGRENILLSAAILGMKPNEVRQDFDKIVDFSGVERFIDMPVKHYSSGMYMRLAFAVAAHLRHEILLIDEVLAVGDASFQQKCVGKISDEARSGRTVLFVSHNMPAILSLCTRAILLQEGRLVQAGSPEEIVDAYLGHMRNLIADREWPDPAHGPGNHMFRIKSVRIVDESRTVRPRLANDQPWYLEIDYWNLIDDSKLGTTLAIYDSVGNCVFGSLSNLEPNWHGKPRPRGVYRSRVRIPGDLMKEGHYRVAVLLWSQGYTDIFRLDEAVEFEIFDSGRLRGDYFGGWEGAVHPRLDWACELIYNHS